LYITLLVGIPWIVGKSIPGSVATCLAMALSLSVLVWPTVRGVPWSQARRDIGLTWGEKPLLEPILGFFSYLNGLPLLAVGLVMVLINTLLYRIIVQAPLQASDPFHPDPSMSHPLNEQLAQGTIADFLPMFLMACVLAPIMEEIAFRGLLYRHLRDATRHWRIGFLFSVLVVSVLFAVVHPQGLLAVPALAALAVGFALAREWRGTLAPSIIAHGLNNALILSLQIMLFMK
jgi:membrane protease YdiL (CAAX protease family)